ncbi:EcoAI/FtnUII family type I restriction enzme subunit R [Flavobacterium aquiphilum]|uniref:EcoAI/FtnUII family type I restriction enzme subunit R n=1 Tax=Flavobacterium aquiphilum TaxID=3003261 RepID=UPI00247FB771|nr:DEAD/DEAH box helicase family protein [Flavobacterium aquiphilum]
MNKKDLSERDICTKFITPALEKAGWDLHKQILEEVFFTDGKIYVRGKLTARGERKRADYILYYQDNPVAVIEAKDNKHSIRSGIQQALSYAVILDIPCVFSSNGDGFLFHDRTVNNLNIESELSLDEFPSPENLWDKYKQYKNIATDNGEKIALQKYFSDGSGRKPRYYQQIAVNRTVEAIANGQDRIILVMATGTGKTYTAFQIIYRLWKSRIKKRILFLADRTALIDQTRKGDFKHFKDKMTIIKKKVITNGNGKDELVSNKKRGIDTSDKAYEVFLGLYQGLTNNEPGIEDAYKDFSPDFFDLIVIDECHRGSANEDSAWREILTYFNKATHIGLTATPTETKETSNTEYFGEPVYTYSLKQGIDDGFLAPYKVIRVALNVDAEGYRPQQGKTDKEGKEIEDRIYNRKDFDRKLVIDERTDIVAQKVTEYLKGFDRYAKTIIFCVDIDHAERMRNAIAIHNADLVAENYKYVIQITGDNEEGKRELDNFINPEEKYPVMATTSELMTTGVDAQTCKVLVLDANINSMTKFKQIVGRGTRINEEFDKLYFTILDFRNATDNFADPAFDGDPLRVKPITEETDLTTIIDEEEEENTPIIDDVTGEEIIIAKPKIRNPVNEPSTEYVKRPKQYINGVNVSVLVSRELFFDSNGKPITISLKDHTKEIIKGKYASLEDFLVTWNQADRKEAIIKELQEQGIMVEALYDAVDKQVDLFDLICHVAYDQPPLTRKERADNVKKRNYFTKYGDQARKVLETLLDKYADEGVENIESIDVLRVKPFDDFGSPLEIIKEFGNKQKYLEAVKELEIELYKKA